MSRLQITARKLPDGTEFIVKGRVAWALNELVKAGEFGCTPIDNPGPRWSAYVYTLRRVYGLAIETFYEAHRGLFPGKHARYVLLSLLELLDEPDLQTPQVP